MNPRTLKVGRIAFGIALFALTVLPLALVLARSFQNPPTRTPPPGLESPDGPAASHSRFTLQYYKKAYGEGANYRAMVNTIVMSLATVIFASLIAIPSAWLVTRTDLPGRAKFRFLLVLPYVIPPYIGAIAWINLCNPRVGWLNRLAGREIFDIYTLAGVVWVLGLFYFTFIYLNCVSAMENTDPSLEEAARVSGASPGRVFLTITLPLMRPAIFSGAFLVFAAASASFGVPELIGSPGHIQVMTTRIYSSIKTGGLDGYYLAAALSTILFAVAIGASSLSDWLAHARRVTALTGKSARRSQVRLGRWRWPAFGYVAMVFAAACVLPFAAVLATSFMKVAGNFSWDNLTLDQYRYVLFERQATLRGFVNSLMLAFGTATLAVGIGTVLAYLKGHPKRRSGPLLDACVNLPYATPGTILAFGLILLWSRPIALTDTLWILLIAYFAKYLSFAVKALTTNVQQIDTTLEEAARVSGAGFIKTFRTIWIPLLRPGMMASWFLVFMPAFSELTMSILLKGPGTETVGTTLFDLQSYRDPPSASVLAVMLLVLILSAYGAAMVLRPKAKTAS